MFLTTARSRSLIHVRLGHTGQLGSQVTLDVLPGLVLLRGTSNGGECTGQDRDDREGTRDAHHEPHMERLSGTSGGIPSSKHVVSRSLGLYVNEAPVEQSRFWLKIVHQLSRESQRPVSSRLVLGLGNRRGGAPRVRAQCGHIARSCLIPWDHRNRVDGHASLVTVRDQRGRPGTMDHEPTLIWGSSKVRTGPRPFENGNRSAARGAPPLRTSRFMEILYPWRPHRGTAGPCPPATRASLEHPR